ncbi:MAG: hypothetical protein LBO80_07135 [Treponema sp.]|jgi:ParB-like chromosome segregation protein Spo0J|nr:hypothetical protein [Treponema sp.]
MAQVYESRKGAAGRLAAVGTRFLRLFREHRDLEKKLDSAEALIASMERYIDALEGRDRERLSRIEELEAKNRDALAALRDASETMDGLRKYCGCRWPDQKEEKT